MKSSVLPHFEPALEREFQSAYYQRIRPSLRITTPLLAFMFAVYALRDLSDTQSAWQALLQDGSLALYFLLLFGLSYTRGFERFWQALIFFGSLLVSAISLHKMASFIAATRVSPALPATAFPADSLYFGQQMRLIMICITLLRLQFAWTVPLQVCLVGIGVAACMGNLLTNSTVNDVSSFLQPTIAVMFAVMLASLVEEQLARKAFMANHLLAEERNDEKRKREQTEAKLRVLAQATGTIVHDLGNPLATVQMGASTLDYFLDQGADKETLKEFTEMIGNGTQVLNHLRLSLIEQTRVLEGKPTRVTVKPTDIRRLVEAGVRFQKADAVAGRAVYMDCPDCIVHADEMKMITVFMNLIGNAMKYSDDEVRVEWRAGESADERQARWLSIAVLDCGIKGKGLTRDQAAGLFTAFGRLDEHALIEGTGLGLLSVQKIMEAHGGEAFIEGYADGSPGSDLFSTAQNQYASVLCGKFRTAFVVTCPLNA